MLPVHEVVALANPAGEYLRFGRLASFYAASAGQLPGVLARHELAPASLEFSRWSGAVEAARLWLFALPHGQVVAALSLDVTSGYLPVIPLLEDLYYADLTESGAPMPLVIAQHADALPGLGSSVEFLPERHQLLFASASGPEGVPQEDTVQRLIYRADLSARDGSTSIRYPGELNRRPDSRAALGPYVSVLVGLQDYVENAALISAVHVVAASTRLRQIREAAYTALTGLRAATAGEVPIRNRRLALERLSNTLRTLNLNLSYSVEAAADLGMLIPALRVESYHEALIDSMSLTKRADTTGRMLARLDNALDAELTSVQSVEARADDARRLRTVAAVTFVTTIVGTIGLLFTFLGVNAREVQSDRSMFDHHYLPIYATIAGIAMAGGAVFAGLAWWQRRQASSST